MSGVLIASICAGVAAHFYFRALEARRELDTDAPVDVTPALRASARNGHLAALFATIALAVPTRLVGRWYVVLPVFLACRVAVEFLLGRASRRDRSG